VRDGVAEKVSLDCRVRPEHFYYLDKSLSVALTSFIAPVYVVFLLEEG